MSESLRDRVEAAVREGLDEWYGKHAPDNPEAARFLTTRAFETMAGARPCVTCGKGIGPAKVEKGYVQCYDCTRKRPVSILHPVFSNPPAETTARHRLGTWTDER